eukprot:TRINITY_DN59784_c0_g1_i1.p1 TRINITY_DN59784_c0_g1~~TRINITY_DN59784_c0_g1_i1.p1  ORF type:complete len:299 (+),score=61.59 TRINITY_DN59784_c0_g1_i1:129-1025(+)
MGWTCCRRRDSRPLLDKPSEGCKDAAEQEVAPVTPAEEDAACKPMCEPIAVDRALSEVENAMLAVLDSAYGGRLSRSDDPADWEGYSTVEATNGGVGDNTALYGELSPASLVCLLGRFAANSSSSPSRSSGGGCSEKRPKFYDLGSGTGKLVHLATLLGWEAVGVELEPGRHREACAARSRLQAAARGAAADTHATATPDPWASFKAPMFKQCSFLDFDFGDADVLFANSVAFSPSMLEAVASTARKLRPGARIVTHKQFPGPGFRDVEVVQMRVSWKAEGVCDYFVQEVVPPAEVSM